MLEYTLSQLWFSDEQSLLYLKMLEIWASPVSTIARYAGFKRETCYYMLKKLAEKWVVSSVNRNGIAFFSAEDPEKIIHHIEWQLRSAKKILPELKMITEKSLKKFKVKFYEWNEWVKQVLDQYIQMPKKEVHIYTNMELFLEIYTEEYTRFLFSRKFEDCVPTKLISPHSPRAEKFLKTLQLLPNDEILLVNQYDFAFENDIVIFDNKVIIISLSRDESYAIYIESDIFSQTQKAIFSLAWLWWSSFMWKW